MTIELYPVRGVIRSGTPFMLMDLDYRVLTTNNEWVFVNDVPIEDVLRLEYYMAHGAYALQRVDNPQQFIRIQDNMLQLAEVEDSQPRLHTISMPSTSVNISWNTLVAGALYYPTVGERVSGPIMLFPLHLFGSDGSVVHGDEAVELARQLRPVIYQPDVTLYYTNKPDAQAARPYRYCYTTDCATDCKGPCTPMMSGRPLTGSRGSDVCQWTEGELARRPDRPHPDYPIDQNQGFRCVYKESLKWPTVRRSVLALAIVVVLLIGGFLVLASMIYRPEAIC